MGLINVFSRSGSNAGVTEKVVGPSAYDNVKLVADNIDAVTSVAGNLDNLIMVSENAAAIVSAANLASTSATNAATSETNAAASALAAASAATSIGDSVTDAYNSEISAAASAVAAAASEESVAANASAATTAASNAAASETNAAASESAAATSAGNAATSETNAASSASAASAAQILTESARDSALAAFDSFDDRYLGAKASDPTLDNDGNPLVAGAIYFSTTDGAMKVYTGSAWTAAYVSGAGVLLQANNLSDISDPNTARTNIGAAAASHTHTAAEITDLASFTGFDARYYTETEVDNLLAVKLDSASFTWANLSGKPSTFPPSAHTHAISEVTGLQTALDGKAATGHTHTAANITDLASYTGFDARYYTEAEVDALIAGAGGGPTTSVATADQTTTSATAVNLTNLGFTPGASTRYKFRAFMVIKISAAGNDFKIGINWPSGLNYGHAVLKHTGRYALAGAFNNGDLSLTHVSNATDPYLSGGLDMGNDEYCTLEIEGILDVGASPTGDLQLQFASNGVTISSVKAGSYIEYEAL